MSFQGDVIMIRCLSKIYKKKVIFVGVRIKHVQSKSVSYNFVLDFERILKECRILRSDTIKKLIII